MVGSCLELLKEKDAMDNVVELNKSMVEFYLNNENPSQ